MHASSLMIRTGAPLRDTFLALCLLFSAPNVMAGEMQKPIVQIQRVTAPFKPDGLLNEAFWKEASAHTGFTTLGKQGVATPQDERTSFQVVLHGSSLIIGVRCRQPEADLLVRTRERGNPSVCADDSLEIFLSPGGDGFYQLALNAEGYLFDRWVGSPGTQAQAWNGAWEGVVHRSREEWTAEVIIPLATLNRHRQVPALTWKLNVARTWGRERVFQSWAPVENGYAEVHRHGALRFPSSASLPATLPGREVVFPEFHVGLTRFSIETTASPGATYLVKTSLRDWKPGLLPARTAFSQPVTASPEGKVTIPLEVEVQKEAVLKEFIVELANPADQTPALLVAHTFRAPQLLSLSREWPVYFPEDKEFLLRAHLKVADARQLEGTLRITVFNRDKRVVHQVMQPLEHRDAYAFPIALEGFKTGRHTVEVEADLGPFGSRRLQETFFLASRPRATGQRDLHAGPAHPSSPKTPNPSRP